MKTKILLTLVMVLIPLVGVFAQYTFPACTNPWSAGTYLQGAQVSHKSINYQAKWYTTAEPGTNGDWSAVGRCGDGGLGPDYSGKQRIIGYLPYWVPNFDLSAYDPSRVSHINVAFNLFKQNNNNYNSADFASIAFAEFHNRKVDSVLFTTNVLSHAHAKGVTVSVAIGGATDYAFLWLLTKYYNNDAKLEEMATLITNYVNAKGIDGVDLDLECWWADGAISGTVDQGGRVRGDKWGGPDQGAHPAGLGLTKLTQKLRQKMPNKLISAAVFATSYYGNNYDDGLAQYADWIGLMTYDFTGSWTASPIGPHAALYKIPLGTYQGQSADNPIYSAQDALEYWMGMAPPAWNHDGGFNAPKAKLVIGVPFYGYDLSSRKPNNGNGFIALKWNEILAAYPNAATSYDPKDSRQLGGYIGADNKKIYYETPKGAGEKIKYTRQYGHQGVIIWELTGDAPYSSSNSLLKAINDAAGNVVNPPPVVNITSPANNAHFAVSSTITISANATDNGAVSKVEFYQGTVKLGEDTTAPYTYSWVNVGSGNYSLTAKATDNENATTVSSAINITVGNTLPVVTITAPANNATFTPGATITINATATDADGTIQKVEFYQGTTKLGEDTAAPYSFAWTNVAAGTYDLTVRATDNDNATSTSGIVKIIVGNSSPAVAITSPANNSNYSPGATIAINATATDADGTILKVEFFQGTTKLGEDTAAPFSWSWNNVPIGNYVLTAKATDNGGAVGTSSSITISVANGKPVAAITSPANNTSFNEPASIVISANATDADGTISKVEFYNGTTLLGTDNTSPYSYTWSGVTAGTYSLTAKATDNLNETGISAAIAISVVKGDNCTSVPQYVENGGYVAGSKVKNQGNQYECKPFPFAGWCNGAAWAYAPGTGAYWQDAWIVKGSCAAPTSARIGASDATYSFNSNPEMKSIEFDADGLSLFPNPGVSGKSHSIHLTFETDPGTVMISVKNSTGSDIVSGYLAKSRNNSISVSLPSLQEGMYFVRVAGDTKVWLRKYQIK